MQLFLRVVGLAAVAALAQAGRVQVVNLTVPLSAADDRASVVKIFNQSYSAYRQFAFGHDEVAPLSEKSLDPRNGWGATIVDAMSTMYIMGFTDYFNEALSFTKTIDFTESNTPDNVSLFESTIRYVGGLISAYELSGKKEENFFLIERAQQLADRLSLAWVNGNTIPFGEIDFSDNTVVNQTISIAEAGTLTLEWSLLSKYTGNDTYEKLAVNTAREIATSPAPLPGLPVQGINPNDGQPVGGYVTWGGGSDSYFEYLIKYAQLSGTVDPIFANSWFTAVDSSIKTLMKTSTVGDHVYLADYDAERSDQERILHVGSHLECFLAGNWLLGGKLGNNQSIVDYGLQLNDACWNTYASDATGIGPETFAYISDDGGYAGNISPSPEQLAFYEEHGYYITGADYVQRPEVLESNFYAWRVTGDTKYLDRARSAVDSFNKYLSTTTGNVTTFAGIYDVNALNSTKVDETESFWFAEVLKYLYLTFDDPNNISLDNYVFNTEAHPFMAPGSTAKANYGSGDYTPSTTDKFVMRPGSMPEPSPGLIPLLDTTGKYHG